MDDGRIVELLERIADGADRAVAVAEKTASGVERLTEAIPKPASRLRRFIELFVTIATIAGILSAVDTIKNWVLGG